MKITKRHLEGMVERLNYRAGFEEVEYLTVGSYRLYHDGVGYRIDKVENSAGGVSVVGNMYGMTTRECYMFLSGLLAR